MYPVRRATNLMLAALAAAPGVASGDPPAAGADNRPVLSGFMDLLAEPGADGRDDRVFRIGQAELDIDARVAEGVGLCLAPAWDPAGERLVLGTAIINLRLNGAGLENFCRERHLGRAGVVAGRFDVPFGIDWLLYPSIDRPLVTMPLPVAASHGGWNAEGVMLYGATGIVNGVLHATDGFDSARALAAGGEDVWTGREAVGGRAGVVPRRGWSLGVSAAAIDAVEDDHFQTLLGLDLIAEHGPWLVRGEYLRRRAEGFGDHVDHGWYAACQWRFGGAYGIARWDEWRPEDQPREKRLSLGAGVPLHDGVILRGEYEWWPAEGRADRLTLQIAAAFGP
jgi:hypothetical protein